MENMRTEERFTEQIYATRNDLIKSLNTSLVDTFWTNILSYRRRYTSCIELYDTRRNQYSVCYCKRITKLSDELTNYGKRIPELFRKIEMNKTSVYRLSHEMLKNSLKAIANHHFIDASDVALESIINGRNNDISYSKIENYFNCLKYLESIDENDIEEDLLANYLMKIRNEQELISFYRTNDLIKKTNYFLSQIPDDVPSSEIDQLMSDLIRFLKDNNVDLMVKIGAIIYTFDYVKPFKEYNEEIAIILAKKVMKQQFGHGLVSIIPMENIICDKKIHNELYKEVIKTKDMTYVINAVGELVNKAIKTLLDRIVVLDTNALRQTAFAGDSKEEFEKEFGFVPNDETVIESNFDEKTNIIEEPIKDVKKEEIPIKIEQKPVSVSPKKIIDKAKEKELKALEIEMLESDPFIRKGQAHFFVRHCEKGKYYTIQDYKKCEGCVYETARTSMDNLAKQGYYKREPVKNKFVYRVIDKE